MRYQVAHKIKKALRSTLNLSEDQVIHSETKLKEDLGLDSMSSLTFLLALEEKIDGFNVNPDLLEMEDLATLDSITNYVCEEIHV